MLEKLKTGFEIFQIIIREGLIGLWRYLQNKLENIIVSTKEQVFSYLKTEVLQAGFIFYYEVAHASGRFHKSLLYDLQDCEIHLGERQKDSGIYQWGAGLDDIESRESGCN